MSDEKLVVGGFGEVEMDAIGEIMNITMGSAATAVSNMLSAKVWITTPSVSLLMAKDLSFPELEPSIMVKIKYTRDVIIIKNLVTKIRVNGIRLCIYPMQHIAFKVLIPKKCFFLIFIYLKRKYANY